MNSDRNFNLIAKRFFYGDARYTDARLRDYSRSSTSCHVEVFFGGIEEKIIELANRYEVVVGAVAWLTNPNILDAFAKNKNIALVVQKEDFLRRDLNSKNYHFWKLKLHKQYDNLNPFDFSDFTESYPGQQEEHPDYNSSVQHWVFNWNGEFINSGYAVRCIGYVESGTRTIPKMHHKFLVFGDKSEGLILHPHCVLSGSFNPTYNATRSRENVLIIEDKAICNAFLSEWAQLWCLSDPLDWTSPEPNNDVINMGT